MSDAESPESPSAPPPPAEPTPTPDAPPSPAAVLPSWRPALAPVEYALAIAFAIAVAMILADAAANAVFQVSGPRPLLAHERQVFLGAARLAMAESFALGFLAWRAERRGHLPGFFAIVGTALVVSLIETVAVFVPMPWGGTGTVSFAKLGAGLPLALLAIGMAFGAAVLSLPRALSYRLALGAQGRWPEGLLLVAPVQGLTALFTGLSYAAVVSFGVKVPARSPGTPSYADATYSGIFRALAMIVLVGVALPLLTRLVPRALRALGIHTRAEPELPAS